MQTKIARVLKVLASTESCWLLTSLLTTYDSECNHKKQETYSKPIYFDNSIDDPFTFKAFSTFEYFNAQSFNMWKVNYFTKIAYFSFIAASELACKLLIVNEMCKGFGAVSWIVCNKMKCFTSMISFHSGLMVLYLTLVFLLVAFDLSGNR